jgi:hypothetical protein
LLIFCVSIFNKINPKWVIKYQLLKQVEKTGISDELLKEFAAARRIAKEKLAAYILKSLY